MVNDVSVSNWTKRTTKYVNIQKPVAPCIKVYPKDVNIGLVGLQMKCSNAGIIQFYSALSKREKVIIDFMHTRMT